MYFIQGQNKKLSAQKSHFYQLGLFQTYIQARWRFGRRRHLVEVDFAFSLIKSEVQFRQREGKLFIIICEGTQTCSAPMVWLQIPPREEQKCWVDTSDIYIKKTFNAAQYLFGSSEVDIFYSCYLNQMNNSKHNINIIYM